MLLQKWVITKGRGGNSSVERTIKVESCERFGKISSSTGAGEKGGLWFWQLVATHNWYKVMVGLLGAKLTRELGQLLEYKIYGFHRNKDLIWFVGGTSTRRQTAKFHAIVLDRQLFVSFYLTNFVRHFTDDLCDFVRTAPRRMK